MQQAFENVEKLLSDMRPLLLQAGIPERQTLMPTGREPDRIKLEVYVEAFDWLHRIYTSGEWAATVKARKLVPEERWATYKAHGFTGLQEQLILESANIKLRKVWKFQRPSFFGKVYSDEESTDPQQDSGPENPEPVVDRPSDQRPAKGNRRGRPRKH